MPKAQEGMQQPTLQEQMQQQGAPQQQQQQADPQQMQQQMMQIIEQALRQGADPRIIYNKLAKQLEGQMDPEMINQMVSMVVDKVKSSMSPSPEDEVVAMAEAETLEQDFNMGMPSQNQMMTDQIMSEEMDESYLTDDNSEQFMKAGGLVSKKKFVNNVLKLAKKQMGDAGKQNTQSASIRDTAQFDRESIKNDFMSGIMQASNTASIKAEAEQEYEMMQAQQEQQQQMQAQMMQQQQMVQRGGYVDGDLQKFCGGGTGGSLRRAQAGDAGKRRNPVVGETWDTWYTSDGSTPGFAPNTTVWNGTEWASEYTKEKKYKTQEEKYKRFLELKREREISDGAQGYTPNGMPIYPGLFDRNPQGGKLGFKYPFNKGVQYAGTYGTPVNARHTSDGTPYTGGINYDDIKRTEVTKSGLFGRPKEWTNYYEEDHIIDPDNPRPAVTKSRYNSTDVPTDDPKANRRDGKKAGLRHLWSQMRADKMQEGGLTKYQLNGEVEFSDDYVEPTWDSAFQNVNAPKNLDAPALPEQYEVNEYMGGEGTPFEDEVSVDYEGKNMYNIDPEAALQQINAFSNYGIGALEGIGEARQQNWLQDQLNADNLHGQTRKRDRGTWNQTGDFRPDAQGFRGVAQLGGEGQAPPQGGGDQMQQLAQQVQQMMEQGAQPEQVVAELLQGDVPPEAIMQVLVQIGMPQEQAQPLIENVMQQMQGGQGGPPQGQPQGPPPEGQPMMQVGGQMTTEGAEIYMSDEEIQRFINEGGELEFI
jgi:hypothetical protein